MSHLGRSELRESVISVGSRDADRLIALVRSFHGESGHTVGPEQIKAIRELCFESRLGHAWVLTIGDRDIGYALAYFRHSIDHGGRIAVLDDLWVTSDRRGRGLGTCLLKVVCADLQAIGARAVILEVDPTNEVAIALYAGFGFVKTGTALYAKGFAQG